jgi:hypothetical protein
MWNLWQDTRRNEGLVGYDAVLLNSPLNKITQGLQCRKGRRGKIL